MQFLKEFHPNFKENFTLFLKEFIQCFRKFHATFKRISCNNFLHDFTQFLRELQAVFSENFIQILGEFYSIFKKILPIF